MQYEAIQVCKLLSELQPFTRPLHPFSQLFLQLYFLPRERVADAYSKYHPDAKHGRTEHWLDNAISSGDDVTQQRADPAVGTVSRGAAHLFLSSSKMEENERDLEEQGATNTCSLLGGEVLLSRLCLKATTVTPRPLILMLSVPDPCNLQIAFAGV